VEYFNHGKGEGLQPFISLHITMKPLTTTVALDKFPERSENGMRGSIIKEHSSRIDTTTADQKHRLAEKRKQMKTVAVACLSARTATSAIATNSTRISTTIT